MMNAPFKMWSNPSDPTSGVVFQESPPDPWWREARIVFDEPEELEVTEGLNEYGHKVWIIDGQSFFLSEPAEGYDSSAKRAERRAEAELRRARRKRKAAELVRERDAAKEREKVAAEQVKLLSDAREALLALKLLVPSAAVVPVLDAIDAADPSRMKR